MTTDAKPERCEWIFQWCPECDRYRRFDIISDYLAECEQCLEPIEIKGGTGLKPCAVGKAYLHELQADAARWRHVRDRLAGQDIMGTWHFDSIRAGRNYRESLDEAVDGLIEEAKREGR